MLCEVEQDAIWPMKNVGESANCDLHTGGMRYLE